MRCEIFKRNFTYVSGDFPARFAFSLRALDLLDSLFLSRFGFFTFLIIQKIKNENDEDGKSTFRFERERHRCQKIWIFIFSTGRETELLKRASRRLISMSQDIVCAVRVSV